jgi:hypothetical protein
VLLNPNPLAASNRQGGKHKGKPQQHGGVTKKLRPAHGTSSNSTGCDGKPILCFKCGKPSQKKADCPTGKEGNGGALNGSAHGSSVALDTQEMHHACMAVACNVTAAEHALCAQVVEKPIAQTNCCGSLATCFYGTLAHEWVWSKLNANDDVPHPRDNVLSWNT